MVILGDNIYVVGGFTSVNGGVPRNNAAAFNRWSGALQPWNPNLNSSAFSITTDGVNLYIVGEFTVAGGVSRNRAVKVDPISGTPLGWNPNLNDDAYSVLYSNQKIYIGGAFTAVNGGVSRTYAAAFNTTNGSVDSGWNAQITGGFAPAVYSVKARPSGSILLAGIFNSVNSAVRYNIAEVDKTTGLPMSYAPKVDGLVYATLEYGPYLYVLGTFNTVGGGFFTRNNLAAFSSLTGAVYNWNPNPNYWSCCIPEFGGLAGGASRVYVGGGFNFMGGQPRNHFAALMPAVTVVATPNVSPTPTYTRTNTPTPTP
jgi:hypothetical protein